MSDCKAELSVIYSDGSKSIFPFVPGKSTDLDDCRTVVAVNAEKLKGYDEYTLTLRATKSLPIESIELQWTVLSAGDDPMVISAGFSTNDTLHAGRTADAINSTHRELILMKNSQTGGLFGAVFTTVDRFFTLFRVTGVNSFAAKWFMEGKPLDVGKDYRLEKLAVGSPETWEAFYDFYTDTMCERYNVHSHKPVPTGFCSWSKYYHNVNQDNIALANKELNDFYAVKQTNTVQIDDGWQTGGSFSGGWIADDSKFPDSLGAVGKKVHADGRAFGLWLAPLLASDNSGFFNEHPEWKNDRAHDGEAKCTYVNGNDPVYPLDIGKPEVREYLKQVFTRCTNEYNADYFKLDFMIFALHRICGRNFYTWYDEDYLVAVYRKTLLAIREAVGDSFMLACGAPIAEGIGIFDGIRIGPDIIWGKNESFPTTWELIKMCVASVSCRYFYNQTMFINDADGLIVRDFDNGDGFDMTYHEARLLATTVAMSGGSSFINESVADMGPSRRKLFSKILPPLGVSARPLDIFETPQPSRLYIKNPDGSVILTVYNFSDKVANSSIQLAAVGITGKALCLKAWTGEIWTVNGCLDAVQMMPHSAEVYVLSPVADAPRFAFSDCDIYGGAGIFTWDFTNGCLTVTASAEIDKCEDKTFYIYAPDGYTLPADSNAIQTESGCLLKQTATARASVVIDFRR